MLWQLTHFNVAAVIPWNLGLFLVGSCTVDIVAVMKVIDQYKKTASAVVLYIFI